MTKKTLVAWGVRLGALSLVTGMVTGLMENGKVVTSASAAQIQNTQDQPQTSINQNTNIAPNGNNTVTSNSNSDTTVTIGDSNQPMVHTRTKAT